jgi:hypothetical protein
MDTNCITVQIWCVTTAHKVVGQVKNSSGLLGVPETDKTTTSHVAQAQLHCYSTSQHDIGDLKYRMTKKLPIHLVQTCVFIIIKYDLVLSDLRCPS